MLIIHGMRHLLPRAICVLLASHLQRAGLSKPYKTTTIGSPAPQDYYFLVSRSSQERSALLAPNSCRQAGSSQKTNPVALRLLLSA